MPHGLFLGSSLATQDRISDLAPYVEKSSKLDLESSEGIPLPSVYTPRKAEKKHLTLPSINSIVSSFLKSLKYVGADDIPLPDCDKGHAGWTNRSFDFVCGHLYHGIVDIVMSLMGFAVTINSLFVYSPLFSSFILIICLLESSLSRVRYFFMVPVVVGRRSPMLGMLYLRTCSKRMILSNNELEKVCCNPLQDL